MRVLILGGTAEARALAAELVGRGVRVTSSLAGRVNNPRLPIGEVREGGFGGPAGLAAWLERERPDVLVDATHPFAARMTASAAEAARATGVRLVVLRRPGWPEGPGEVRVPSLEAAAAELAPGDRVFLTTGRRSLPVFAGLPGVWFLARSVDAPEGPVPGNVHVVLGRGPYDLDGELALIDQHRLGVLVTKDSGGELTKAKLTAARQRRLKLIVVERPPLPRGLTCVETVADALRDIGVG
ncbi:cobalt-precorrin-6A reductase [Nonomuraea sp. NPDC050663]|uniref:cobalt-precorrin-6A reductase n=1 Tax=Nonomuraea sp. NPDC050663 TaxID=3364370 RepID=UPI0037B74830